jgi:hypothetical protein
LDPNEWNQNENHTRFESMKYVAPKKRLPSKKSNSSSVDKLTTVVSTPVLIASPTRRFMIEFALQAKEIG